MTMKQQRGAFSGWYMAGVSTLQRGKSVCIPVSPGWRPPSLTASAVEESYGARSVRMLETGRMCPKPMDVRCVNHGICCFWVENFIFDAYLKWFKSIYIWYSTLYLLFPSEFDGDLMVIWWWSMVIFHRLFFLAVFRRASPFYGDRWWFDGGAWWFSLGVPRPEIGLHFSLLFLFFVYWHFVSPVICLQVASS